MLNLRALVRQKSRLILAAVVLCLCFFWIRSDDGQAALPTACHVTSAIPAQHIPKAHPIDALIVEAERQQDAVLRNATTRLEDGVSDYRRRRGRPPPPGFDRWYARASKSSLVVVESFFDQIYEDMEPFWGISTGDIRSSISTWEWTLKLRDGKVQLPPKKRFRTETWAQMIEKLSPGLLPDMDIPVNYLDEPRVFAPWNVIDKSVSKASAQKKKMMQLSDDEILRRVAKPIPEQHIPVSSHPEWITKGDIWPHILNTCPPSATPELDDGTYPSGTNWTAAKDVCANHHWADLHGALIKPASMAITTNLIPMFSAAKLQGSNDILLPPPSYYSDNSLFTGRRWFGDGIASTPWHKKIHGLIWRGKATGGRIHHSEWRNFHRQRLVSMLNGSETARFEDDEHIGWPNTPEGGNKGTKGRGDLITVSTWLRKVSDAAFTDLFLPKKDQDARDQAIANRYRVRKSISMPKQYKYKYLPDIDGNSLSGRFRAFLRSNSSPMKATIFKEWHDSRLIPWAHFIPIDITLRDLWLTMAYFLGFAEIPPHDFEGNVIACNGRNWAETVLRKEDMLLYTYRILLEFARICDDDRDRLGFVLG